MALNPLTVNTTQLAVGQSSYTIPAQVFNSYGIDPLGNKSSALIQGMDDIVSDSMMSTIYNFAQTKTSACMGIPDVVEPMSGGSAVYMREGNVDLSVKNFAGEPTPYTSIDHDKRRIFETLLHRGFNQDIDNMRRTILDLTGRFQVKLIYALARNMDKLFQFSCTNGVVGEVQTVNINYAGARTNVIIPFLDSQRIVRTNGKSTTGELKIAKLSDQTAGNLSGFKFFNNIIARIHEAMIPLHECCIIGSPELRRQIKEILEFRDRDNHVSFAGNEDDRMLNWLNIKFLFLNRDAYLNMKQDFAFKTFDTDGRITGISAQAAVPALLAKTDTKPVYNAIPAIPQSGITESAGGTTAQRGKLKNVGNTAAVTGADIETFLVVAKSGLVRGDVSGSSFMGMADRFDFSFSKMIYIKAGVAFSRIDELKVWQYLYKADLIS